MRTLLLALVRGYRYLISPWLGNHCRFVPSCSEYAETAIREHGPARGSWLAAKRLGRCHPWHPGGLDPVPPAAGCCAAAADQTREPAAESAAGTGPADHPHPEQHTRKD